MLSGGDLNEKPFLVSFLLFRQRGETTAFRNVSRILNDSPELVIFFPVFTNYLITKAHPRFKNILNTFPLAPF